MEKLTLTHDELIALLTTNPEQATRYATLQRDLIALVKEAREHSHSVHVTTHVHAPEQPLRKGINELLVKNRAQGKK